MGLTEWFDRDLVLETASPKLDRKLTNQSGGDDENGDDHEEDDDHHDHQNVEKGGGGWHQGVWHEQHTKVDILFISVRVLAKLVAK